MNKYSVNERLTLLSNIVKDHLIEAASKYPHPSHNPGYRMEHTLRVAHYGKMIAIEEGAQIELVIAACLLHDIAHFESENDYKNHGRLGAQMSRPILMKLNYSLQDIDAICYSIAAHVDGDAGYAHPHCLEAQIVSDADNIDRFGAYRAILWCTEDVESYEHLLEKLKRRVDKLKQYQLDNPLETRTGRLMFGKQLELQIDFFNKIIREGEITLPPQLII